jgi:hypothetical protein
VTRHDISRLMEVKRHKEKNVVKVSRCETGHLSHRCPIVVFPPSHFGKNDYIIEHSHFSPQFLTGGKVAI